MIIKCFDRYLYQNCVDKKALPNRITSNAVNTSWKQLGSVWMEMLCV